MNNIQFYIQIAAYTILSVSSIVLGIKLLKTKIDKNKNGKIEKEEIEEANYDYVMSFLIDTLKIITKGICNDTGCKVITAQKLINKALKNQEITKIEKEIKEDFENQEQIKQQENYDKQLEMEMLKKQKLFEQINNEMKGENENA